MKLKFALFENREDYEKALREGGDPEWNRIDADECRADELAGFLDMFAAAEGNTLSPGQTDVFVIDRDGESSDDLRDHRPLEGRHYDQIFAEILEYFAETRMKDFPDLICHALHEGYDDLTARLFVFLLYQTGFSLKKTFGDWLEDFLQKDAERIAAEARRCEEAFNIEGMVYRIKAERRIRFLKKAVSARMQAEESGVLNINGEKK